MNPESDFALRAASENSSYGVFVLAANSSINSSQINANPGNAPRILAANAICAKVFALSNEALFQDHPGNDPSVDVINATNHYSKQCVETREPVTFQVSTRSDRSHLLTITLFPLLEASGDVEQIVGICQPINIKSLSGNSQPIDSKEPSAAHAEVAAIAAPGEHSAVEQSQRWLGSLIDSLPGIVFSCANDSEWSMRYLSKGCFELTGYDSDELVGPDRIVSYNAVTHPEDLPDVLNSIAQAIAKHEPYMIEYRIRTKSGQEKWLWEKGRGIYDQEGNVLSLEGFITDITELKCAEKALREKESFLQLVLDNILCQSSGKISTPFTWAVTRTLSMI